MKNFIKQLSTLFGLFLFVFFIALSTGCGDEKKDKNDDNDTDQTDNDNKDKNDDENIDKENIVLKACIDSTISRMGYKSKDTSVMAKMNLELMKEYGTDFESIARCGCVELTNRYPDANYEELDSLGDNLTFQLLRVCVSDEFVWKTFKNGLIAFGGMSDEASTCLIEVLKSNVLLDSMISSPDNLDYYFEKYTHECSEFFKRGDDIKDCSSNCQKSCCLGCQATKGEVKCKEDHSCCGDPSGDRDWDDDTAFGVINDPDGYTNVRSGKSSKSEILFKIYEGEEFEILDETGDWWLIEYNGEEGYIYYDRVEYAQ